MDRLLLQTILPLVQKILAAGHADRWFFIRYNDPHLHLRLRFHGDPKRLSSEVLPKLWEYANPEIQRGTLWRVQLDTYEREIERYGGLEGIEIAERFFHLDSELVLELLSTLRLSANPAARWQSACYSVDRLLSGLGFNTNEKRQIVNKSGKYYEKNFSVDQRYKKQISDKFRNERSTLEKIVAGSEELDTFPPGIHYAIAAYAERIKTIRADLEAKSATGELTQPISEMASSYVHMHLNRLFRSAQNAQEMVIYDFLARTYDSKMAKEKRER
jgi:thiopeptide-type bacteriocin biosynthesis protein